MDKRRKSRSSIKNDLIVSMPIIKTKKEYLNRLLEHTRDSSSFDYQESLFNSVKQEVEKVDDDLVRQIVDARVSVEPESKRQLAS